MTEYKEENLVPFKAEKMFALVADIESYPEFLPWCLGVNILSKKDEIIDGEKKTIIRALLKVGFGFIKESYESEVTLDEKAKTIAVHYITGPFKYLENTWFFEEKENDTCLVHFYIRFAFKNPLLESIVGGFFDKAFQKMVNAFMERAKNMP